MAANMLEQLSSGLADAVDRAAASVVLVNARGRIPASGVVWSADGLIVTADHVIEREEGIEVHLPDDRTVAATLVGRDPGSDIALLKAVTGGLTAAERLPANSARVGHMVLAVARPSKGGPQASIGVVGAIGGPWRNRRGGRLSGYIQSDVTFFPGFSGGPLVDAQGRVLGINSAGFRPGQGITIPAADVEEIANALTKQGHIRRPYLGVGSQAVRLPQALAGRVGGQETGLMILSVEQGSAAATAGVLLGDILVRVEGESIHDAEDLLNQLTPERVGQQVRLTLLRGGEPVEIAATLGERA